MEVCAPVCEKEKEATECKITVLAPQSARVQMEVIEREESKEKTRVITKEERNSASKSEQSAEVALK